MSHNVHDKIYNLYFQSEGCWLKFACLLSSYLKAISGNLGWMECAPLPSSYYRLVEYSILFLNYYLLFIYFVTHLKYLQYIYVNWLQYKYNYLPYLQYCIRLQYYNITAYLPIAFAIISSFFLGYLHWSKPSFCHCEDNCQGCEWQPTHVCGRPVFRDCVGKRFSWNDSYESNSSG